jgi:hypothetical protein
MGVDPTSVQMQVDGRPVTAEYHVGTGELAYLPSLELTAGIHRVTISARDIAGTSSSVISAFTVGNAGKIYLPVVQHK